MSDVPSIVVPDGGVWVNDINGRPLIVMPNKSSDDAILADILRRLLREYMVREIGERFQARIPTPFGFTINDLSDTEAEAIRRVLEQ